MASLNQSGRSCEVRLQAWLCTFYLAPLSGCSDPSLSDPELLRDHSKITPAQFPERSGHASPCSGYAPGGSGSQKRREVGPKTERASVEISAENIYNSGETGVFSTAVRILQRHLATTRPLYTVMDKTIGLPSERSS
ncbi:uncharacterized protein EURHEDRAFT_53434 [Aspergillus ruber CBS 135680]|uniref:Uncharacterized protein n=1 Tax=Aspergillus ruber (strain CBS 135680) TaxID=1388766 RepID=A0A017SE71_ASPRC|nr:uncharacterized protein EURHEDRAFT_53434 [Aspergillus ruber CBS 135680]EYE95262.1 hypothetical protein EURHEDRAFT_53434 [Aspergillus ruber CBS 135680]